MYKTRVHFVCTYKTFCVRIVRVLDKTFCQHIIYMANKVDDLSTNTSRMVLHRFAQKHFDESLDEMFCRANILFFCHAQNIYNHRLCWPPGVFVENSFLSYNSKNK